jgi:hypothetical protein
MSWAVEQSAADAEFFGNLGNGFTGVEQINGLGLELCDVSLLPVPGQIGFAGMHAQEQVHWIGLSDSETQ